jgi:leucyl-tRNA synthetase
MIWTRVSHGMILGPNNEKMSKSKGNVINPDDIVNEYGADVLRIYEMFIGDYTQDAPWSTETLNGCKRFLDRIIRIGEKLNDKVGYTDLTLANKTIKKVTDDNLNMKYNTAISSLMTLLNEYEKFENGITREDYRLLLTLLNPTAPHITEELNEKYNLGEVICKSSWPIVDERYLVEKNFTLVVQVNGKVRGKITVDSNTTEEKMKELALNIDNVKVYTENKEIVKIIVVPKKLVSIVVK